MNNRLHPESCKRHIWKTRSFLTCDEWLKSSWHVTYPMSLSYVTVKDCTLRGETKLLHYFFMSNTKNNLYSFHRVLKTKSGFCESFALPAERPALHIVHRRSHTHTHTNTHTREHAQNTQTTHTHTQSHTFTLTYTHTHTEFKDVNCLAVCNGKYFGRCNFAKVSFVFI